MDPRKIVLVVLAAAFTVGAGVLQATSSAGAQPETALPAGPQAGPPAACEPPVAPVPPEPQSLVEPAALDRDAVRSESELIDVLARAYRSMDLDLYATLFANPHQHGVEFRFVLYEPSDKGETEWGYDEEIRIHRRMFRPEALQEGESPVPPHLWLRAIDVVLSRLGSWTERFDLYRSEHNPEGPLDRHRWRATSAVYATSVTWHTVACGRMHIEGQARFVVIEDLTKLAGEPGKLLVYRWEDLGSVVGGLARADD